MRVIRFDVGISTNTCPLSERGVARWECERCVYFASGVDDVFCSYPDRDFRVRQVAEGILKRLPSECPYCHRGLEDFYPSREEIEKARKEGR